MIGSFLSSLFHIQYIDRYRRRKLNLPTLNFYDKKKYLVRKVNSRNDHDGEPNSETLCPDLDHRIVCKKLKHEMYMIRFLRIC